MELTSTLSGDAMIVTIEESRIEAAVAIQFKDAMRAITEGGPARVILDMEKVEFVDSSGLGAIVASMKQLAGSHKLELAALSPVVAKVFHLTRMDSVFAIHESLADATAAKAS